MKIKELYMPPCADLYAFCADWALALSFNQNEQTENLGWDSDEENL